MTAKKDLKNLVRERMQKTGERYAAALKHVQASPTRESPEQIRLEQLLSYTRRGQEPLVPADSPSYGPYRAVRLVPEQQVAAILATGEWREVTGAEWHDALGPFEDYGSGSEDSW